MGQRTMSRDEFIAAMRRVANSVSVVTTDGPAGRHGSTVSSFCSVSADPPMVLACLNASSKIARLVKENGAFKINVLPAGASDVADRFAGRDDCNLTDRFEGVPTSGELPGLPGATSFSCTLANTVIAGTHLVCFGLVNHVASGANVPLTYLDGRYDQVFKQQAAQ